MKPFRLDLHSLPAQMILSFVALILLSALSAGLPALWLIREQLDGQAWAQVDQGIQAARALYTAKQTELASMALLAAQRPTLRTLLAQGEQTELQAYLHALQTGMRLDWVLLCDAEHRAVAQAGEGIPDDLCGAAKATGFHLRLAETVPQGWLFASCPTGDEAAGMGEVVVGVALDDEFAVQMRAQTGLEHTLLLDGQPIATSLANSAMPWIADSHQRIGPGPSEGTERWKFDLTDQPYYATQFPLGESTLKGEVALLVADIAATQRRLAWTLAGSILATAAIGSVLAVFLSRRIGRPLARLAEAAAALHQDDLDSSVAIETRVREVALLSHVLEGARAELQQNLIDLRKERAWRDHLLESIVEGIVTLDRHGRITFFSHGAERITGWGRAHVIGRICDEVFRPADTDEPFTQLIPTPGQRGKVTVTLRGGRQATLDITGARLLPPEAGEARVALVFRDASEEEAMHRLLGHFLANAAHEFRTPLSALAASIELLLDQAADLSPAELQELLVSLHLGILRLQTLVDNLLESASIEAGHFQVHPRSADLEAIIAEATDMMRPLLEKYNQRLTIALPTVLPTVQVDPRRIMQVLINLLSNASKYGPDDAEIEIGAAVGERQVRVTVADQGPGIPLEHHDHVFSRFVHLDLDQDWAQGGTGLGLSVVKAIIVAHSGQVGVEGRSGGGSVFWFTVPLIAGQ